MSYHGLGQMHVLCDRCERCSGKHLAVDDAPFAGQMMDFVQELKSEGFVIGQTGCD